MDFSTFFENHSNGLYKCWKRGIGLKIGHANTRMASYTTVTTNEYSDHWARFRSGTDVPYHRVSIDTTFHLQSKTLVHSAELSSSLFSATVHQLALIGIVQGNVFRTFQYGAPTIPKNDLIRYDTQDITTSSNKML